MQSIPSLLSLVDSGKLPPIGLVGDHQYENASLAVALSHAWLDQRKKRNLLPIDFNNLPQPTLEGKRVEIMFQGIIMYLRTSQSDFSMPRADGENFTKRSVLFRYCTYANQREFIRSTFSFHFRGNIMI